MSKREEKNQEKRGGKGRREGEDGVNERIVGSQ